ncbi:Membrane protein, Rhomboid [Alteromonas stellipolaris LMG 21856]|jgi:rhomboid family GlyGly-CTERM serine protease|nr:Membrane protein, Rhomboid [Alteromonas stellipolaris LMG 21856]|tara:strand:+ start:17 stop:604 length:588 start_codon:yes stop_codon:yes gene_type:complete
MMMSLPVSPKYSVGPLILALCAIVAFFLEPLSGEWLAYDRFAIQGLETWRLLSGNIVHTNGYHLLLNLSGLTLLWALHGEHYRIGRFLKVFVWCSLGTSAGLYLFSEDLIWYAGLSGALHGIFVWGALMDIMNKMRSGWILLGGVALKVVYEQISGSSAQVAALIDAKVAIDSHLFGAVSGLIIFTLMWLTAKKR